MAYIFNTTFGQNQAAIKGGGIYVAKASVEIVGGLLQGNMVGVSDGLSVEETFSTRPLGGGIYTNYPIEMSDVHLKGNQAGRGGGLYATISTDERPLNLSGCTFDSNVAFEAYINGKTYSGTGGGDILVRTRILSLCSHPI